MIQCENADAVRKELIANICQAAKTLGLKQVDLAARLDITQPRLSNLLSGKYEMFTIDTLLSLASKVGLQFHYRIEPA